MFAVLCVQPMQLYTVSISFVKCLVSVDTKCVTKILRLFLVIKCKIYEPEAVALVCRESKHLRMVYRWLVWQQLTVTDLCLISCGQGHSRGRDDLHTS